MLLTLVSSDQRTFSVERQVLKQSATIDSLVANLNLEETDTDPASMPIPVPNVNGTILAKVLDWCNEHRNDAAREGDEDNVEVVIPAWDQTFLDAVDQTTLLELTVAANYLDIKGLLNVTCKAIANKMKDRTGAQIRDDWDVENEFSPEEEEAIKKENEWSE